MYTINIAIQNDHGEILDRRFKFATLDEVRDIDMNKIVDDATDIAKENLMYLEELTTNQNV